MSAKIVGPRFEINKDDALYPDKLRDCANPPERLYVIGAPEVLSRRSIAIIGARKATPYGLSCARSFSHVVVEEGGVVVSGGARGVDAQSHRSALEVGGATIAVLGCGLDQIYPPEHAGLFQEIVDKGGALVSEQPWNIAARPHMFRERNRIIASLCDALLNCECGLPSGTFSACEDALSIGRDVLAVPCDITRPMNGCNLLIESGALSMLSSHTFALYLHDKGFSPAIDT